MATKERQGPEESATEFKVGTIKIGNDGNRWIISKNSKGVHRWVKKGQELDFVSFAKDTSDVRSFKLGDTIKHFASKLDKRPKLVKLGKMTLSGSGSHIGVGEIIMNKMKADPDAESYHVYEWSGSLLACPEGCDFKNTEFVLSKMTAACDIGMFAFVDIDDKLIKSSLAKSKNKSLLFPEQEFDLLEIISNKTRKIRDNDAYVVYKSDYTDDSKVDKTDKKKIIAFFAANHTGDGTFPIYKSKDMCYLIMSDEIVSLFKRLL